ncbi:MAG: NAD(P)H-dependent oxidoreductase [Bacteroidetes bacterium]|nr:NAD(P)H-dependent oxidoreductase [Bacteroidota bacterium]
MEPVLLLFGHPAYEKSRINQKLIRAASQIDGIHLHDLYECYPDYNIDVQAEQARLTGYNRIILQHPFYWYNCPPLVKQWIDLVLEHGWAYGSKGTALAGKSILQIVTTGGPAMAYQRSGFNRFSLRDFLSPFDQTFYLCGMHYLPPLAIQGAHRIQPEELDSEIKRYIRLLEAFRDGDYSNQTAEGIELASEWPVLKEVR